MQGGFTEPNSVGGVTAAIERGVGFSRRHNVPGPQATPGIHRNVEGAVYKLKRSRAESKSSVRSWDLLEKRKIGKHT